jgi:O-antigen/teichoic acid export membrane protein
MRKKFAKNLSILLFSNLLIKPLWIFAIDRQVQITIGAEAYGDYFAAINLSYLFSILLDLGINNFTNRAVSRSPSRAASYLPNLVRIKLLLGLIYLCVTLFVAWLSSFSVWVIFLVFLLSVNQLVLSYLLHLRAYIAALQHFKFDALISVSDKTLAIVFMFSFFLLYASPASEHTILFFVLSQILALLLTLGFVYYWLVKHIKPTVSRWNLRFTRSILLKSFPFALLVLQMTIYGRIDGILLHRLLPQSAEETGIYAAGYRLLDAATQFGYLSATILLPMFAAAFRQRTDLKPLVGMSAFFIITSALILALFCNEYSMQIVGLLYKTADYRYGEVLSLLMFTFVPVSSVYVFGTLLTAKGELKMLNVIATVGIIFNIALNVYLIPKQGAIGAAKAALITQTVVALAHALACFPVIRPAKFHSQPSASKYL